MHTMGPSVKPYRFGIGVNERSTNSNHRKLESASCPQSSEYRRTDEPASTARARAASPGRRWRARSSISLVAVTLAWAWASEALGDGLPFVTVPTRSYDNARTGANNQETVLTQSTVSSGFHKLFTTPVDDEIRAQILYVASLPMDNSAVLSNVIFVATVNNTVYAIDADRGTVYWTANLGIPPTYGGVPGCQNFDNNIGIVGTPVIDVPNGHMYVVARTSQHGVNPYELVRFDLTTGFASYQPTIQPSGFNSYYENQRASLALSGNTVYVAFGAYCDTGPYHGWIIGYDATTLAQTGVWNSTAGGAQGGIWQSGQAPVVAPQPGSGATNVWLATGNGSYGGNNLGMSLVELGPTLNVLGSFTPSNWPTLSANDQDLSANGPTLMGSSIIQGGKDGTLYVTAQNLVGSGGSGGLLQSFWAVPPSGNKLYNGGVAWMSDPNGPIYTVWGVYDWPRSYRFNGTAFNTDRYGNVVPSAIGNVKSVKAQANGAMAVSSDGVTLQSGILWATNNFQFSYDVLYAFAAEGLSLVWSSDLAKGDAIGQMAMWDPPTIANGKVYVPTFSKQIPVYGLAPVFWGQNFGYQWNPLPYDWAYGSYKGECQIGQAVTGLSEYANGNHQAHKVMCSNSMVTTASSCSTQGFNSSLPANPSWDWDPGYYKAECPTGNYLQGVAQSQGGVLSQTLCCPANGGDAGEYFTYDQYWCSVQVFSSADSQDYKSPDWDAGYYKGECPSGEVAVGASSITTTGAPHALLCCWPRFN